MYPAAPPRPCARSPRTSPGTATLCPRCSWLASCPSVPSTLSCTTSLPVYGATRSTPSLGSCSWPSSCCSSSPPSSLLPWCTSSWPARTIVGGGAPCSAAGLPDSSSTPTPSSTTSSAPTWKASCRAPSTLATWRSSRTLSSSCWGPLGSSARCCLSATSTVWSSAIEKERGVDINTMSSNHLANVATVLRSSTECARITSGGMV
mmetsp:Transcript_6274/g.9517  ORF Transcript_6274/g.9517 Transcript_6274/m.9517 type:complete len:205 (-) Transcript_6274:200-814(-)